MERKAALKRSWDAVLKIVSLVTIVSTIAGQITMASEVMPRRRPYISIPLPPEEELAEVLRTDEHFMDFFLTTIDAETHVLVEDYDQALADLAHAIRLKPDRIELYYYRGLLYLHMNQLARGREELRRALALSPDAEWRGKINKELWLSVIAEAVSALLPVGIILLGLLYILSWLEMRVSWKRWTWIAIAIVLGAYFAAFFFLLLH